MKKNDQVIYNGKVCTVFEVKGNTVTLDTGFAPVMYETVSVSRVKMHKEYVAPVTILTVTWKMQQAQADINTAKPISELEVGDLIWLNEFGSKNCGDCIGTMSECTPYRTMARIEKIVYDITIEDVDSESFGQGKGGSQSDCIPDNWKGEFTEEQRETFYSVVTLIKLKDGRHLFCDAQGYDYPRYILASDGWEEMFEPELTAERNRIAEYERQREEEFKADRARQKARAEEYVRTVLKDFKPAKTPKANVKRLLNIICPDIKFELKQDTYWSTPEIYVNAAKEDAKTLKRAWDELQSAIWYQSGETKHDWDDYYGSYEYEPKYCALDAKIGNVHFDVVNA